MSTCWRCLYVTHYLSDVMHCSLTLLLSPHALYLAPSHHHSYFTLFPSLYLTLLVAHFTLTSCLPPLSPLPRSFSLSPILSHPLLVSTAEFYSL